MPPRAAISPAHFVAPQWMRMLRRALVLAAVVLNCILVIKSLAELAGGAQPIDWYTLVESGHRVRSGGLYDLSDTYLFRWSPVAAWIMALLAPIGVVGWQLAHVAAVLALRQVKVIAIVLVSWPFWADLGNGNAVTFLFVLGVLAMQGSTAAGLGYLAFFVLAPRPLAAPLAIWLLWRRPALRLPFIAIFGIHAGLVLASGWGIAWIGVLGASGAELGNLYNLGPSKLIGVWWVPIGLALAAFLTLRDRLGWASVVASPYLFPQYLMMGFLELVQLRPTRTGTQSPVSPTNTKPIAGSVEAGD